ncbi:MAG: glycosyltransferase family 39 protein [Elusimicrobiota bacterium]
MERAIRPWAWGLMIWVAYALLCGLCIARIEPGNAPDERAHAEYALHLARTGSLPDPHAWPADPYAYEAHQPPLYYWAGSLALRALPVSSPLGQVRTLRAVSTLCHLAALVLTYLLCRRLGMSAAAALGPTALAALLPMFVFIGSTVTNDAAVNLAGTAILLATAASASGLWIGLAMGLGMLSKSTLLPVAGACLLYLLVKERAWKKVCLALLTAALIAGWFYLRNLRAYGDPWGYSHSSAYDPNRFGLSQLPSWLILYFQSFWGRFGQMTQPMPTAVYVLLLAWTGLALGGWTRDWRTLARKPGRPLLLLALGLALAQNFVYGFFMSYQPQGRFSFIAIAAWAVLFWDGLASWLRTRSL